MIALIPVRIVRRVIGIDFALRHILRNIVVAFSGHTGNHNNSCIRKFFCISDQLIAVILHRRLWKIPVLRCNGNRSTVFCKAGIKINQFPIYFKSCIPDCFNQAYLRIQIVDTAGTCPTIYRVGRAPAKEIQLFGFFQRKDSLIFQQDKAFFCNLQCYSRGFLRKFL